ncbi:MAG: hypothetical protein ABJB33_00315 [Gemmatimonadota bacterium]
MILRNPTRGGVATIASLLLLLVLPLTSCGGSDPSDPPGAAVVAALLLNPAADTLVVKDGMTLVATALDVNGDTVENAELAWSSLDTANATVVSAVVTTKKVGSARIVVAAGGVADTATLTIIPNLVIDLSAGAGLMVGDTLPLALQYRDKFGAPVAVTATPVWTVTAPSVASVDSLGRVVGAFAGTTLVKVSAAGASTQVSVRVFAAALADRELGFRIERPRPVDGLSAGAIYMISATGGDLTLVSDSNDFVAVFGWAPDGASVVAYTLNYNGIGRSGTFVHPLGTGTFTQVSPRGNAPQWSPDGQRIIFAEHDLGSSNVDIVSTLLDGSGRIPLSSGGGIEHLPAPSPDGRWIAYRSGEPPNAQIVLVRPDGTGARTLTLPFNITGFAWSPDGRFIAFDGNKGPSSNGAWVIRPDGTGLTSLTPDCTNAGSCSAVTYHGVPSWHPDGHKVIYFRTPPSGEWELRTVDRAGTFLRSVPNKCGLGRYSPSGARLATIDTIADPNYCRLVMMNADGSGRQLLDLAPIPGINTINTVSDLRWRP